jgi:hypothetical protein
MAEVTVEVGERVVMTRPTVLRNGPEYDALYPKLVQYWPDLLEYQKNTDRTFPLIRLDPIAT